MDFSKVKPWDAHEVYENLNRKKMDKYDLIIGCLNRIAVSDNEEEVESAYKAIHTYLPEYKKLARETHEAFKYFNDVTIAQIKRNKEHLF